MATFAERVIEFNRTVEFTGTLPAGIRIMNPFRENEQAAALSEQFYMKYYSDNGLRRLILGINPGRHGAGFTGIPFTDTKRLSSACGIPWQGRQTHEPSSVFVYEVIDAYGGPEKFYRDFYISSVIPLGFTTVSDRGGEKNYNYYDRSDLTAAVKEFAIWNIRKQTGMGVSTDVCYCLGKGRNEKFLSDLNRQHGFFKKLIALEHPRWVMQYKSASKQEFLQKYIRLFGE